MKEIVKYNCHVLKYNDLPNDITPEKLFEQYQSIPADYHMILQDTKVVVVSCKFSSGNSVILTTVKRIDE